MRLERIVGGLVVGGRQIDQFGIVGFGGEARRRRTRRACAALVALAFGVAVQAQDAQLAIAQQGDIVVVVEQQRARFVGGPVQHVLSEEWRW